MSSQFCEPRKGMQQLYSTDRLELGQPIHLLCIAEEHGVAKELRTSLYTQCTRCCRRCATGAAVLVQANCSRQHTLGHALICALDQLLTIIKYRFYTETHVWLII
jgi:hypothetical protein